MKACTFFGHRDCPETIKPYLREVLVDLITNQGVDTFYVGNQGRFDVTVRSVLRELEQEYPEIHYAVVLAYMPGKKNEYDDFSDTILPEGIETVHLRYAIILWFREKQRGGCRGCCFLCHRGWISGIRYLPGGRCRHRRSGLVLPYPQPAVSPQWNCQKADTR